ncbi:protein of unknown function DUF1697 [Novosphingobium aromaticivorans DSM 12444]|uniref:DUF1697 domain-containing protein n=1 Tax=Novosphingobium aromaticivorans (strain ATCC 700278 / DSM 12444 / CCUG 56034 / CIP 105152 / NBRC 16084 / F199) TaxID=279238 RepID=Q2G5E8_NOVAD|nr:DUF1697 domain-containing protein [Novosphingobium aromaticivorans]ABD26925.1 protein of unknown function DUF1697 [Novosphingobium aromaticivorans DSM 12444]SCY45706.1 Uncharacterized conserved protein, DUF1697 family [Novosphingobium aromaticivorans]
MTRYVALFGSINVGGNRVTMADLRWAFEREGLTGLETVVASGNLLFDYDDRPLDGLEDLFSHVMLDRFDIKSFVAVRDRAAIAEAVEGNPFTGIGADNQVHTLFLERQPDQAAFDKLVADQAARGLEKFAIGNRCIYIDFVEGVGDSKLSSAFLERRLGCRGTARNVRSIARILAKMS